MADMHNLSSRIVQLTEEYREKCRSLLWNSKRDVNRKLQTIFKHIKSKGIPESSQISLFLVKIQDLEAQAAKSGKKPTTKKHKTELCRDYRDFGLRFLAGRFPCVDDVPQLIARMGPGNKPKDIAMLVSDLAAGFEREYPRYFNTAKKKDEFVNWTRKEGVHLRISRLLQLSLEQRGGSSLGRLADVSAESVLERLAEVAVESVEMDVRVSREAFATCSADDSAVVSCRHCPITRAYFIIWQLHQRVDSALIYRSCQSNPPMLAPQTAPLQKSAVQVQPQVVLRVIAQAKF